MTIGEAIELKQARADDAAVCALVDAFLEARDRLLDIALIARNERP